MSPTEYVLRELRKDGWLAEVVEKWIPMARVRRDLFGVLDIVALRDGITKGVQATSKSNMASRIKKIAEAEATPLLRRAGWQLEVWGTYKEKNRWKARIVDVS